ncbi:hypothetical protein Sjap_014421 [Stephania japonica]|uniref:AT3G52170-like helix-turn-helix domain-containing protein n=1 Tax=Stephania japonica TaxID=461633 RepID=A0AAP0IH69_9MAGN
MQAATRRPLAFSLHHKSNATATAAAAASVRSRSSLSVQTTTEHFAASDSSSHKPRPPTPINKISKDERRSLLQAFVLQYQASNAGKFPSTTAAKKQVGGCYYVVKRILQELQSQPQPQQQNHINAAARSPSTSTSDRSTLKKQSHTTTIEIIQEVLHAQTVDDVEPKAISKEEPTLQTPAHVNASTPPSPSVQDAAQQTTNPDHLQRNEHEDQLQKKTNIWRNLRSFADGIISLWSKK